MLSHLVDQVLTQGESPILDHVAAMLVQRYQGGNWIGPVHCRSRVLPRSVLDRGFGADNAGAGTGAVRLLQGRR